MNILAHSLCTSTSTSGQILRTGIVSQKKYEFQLIVPHGFLHGSNTLPELCNFYLFLHSFAKTSFNSNFELFTNLISEIWFWLYFFNHLHFIYCELLILVLFFSRSINFSYWHSKTFTRTSISYDASIFPSVCHF